MSRQCLCEAAEALVVPCGGGSNRDQVTCEGATLIPFLEGRMNATLGCYGCRDATDIGDDETVIGSPGTMLETVANGRRALGERAIPAVRSRRGYRRLTASADCGDGEQDERKLHSGHTRAPGREELEPT